MKKKESTFLLVSLEDEKARKLANVISSDTARKLLDALTSGSQTETELSKKLGLPLSTIHYNLKLLVEGGLVDSSEYHYSSRGREVAHYSLARKYIIIAPKSDEKLFSRFKNILPAAILTLSVGIAAWIWEKTRISAPEIADLEIAAPQAVMMKTSGAIQPAEPSTIAWFFYGFIVFLVCLGTLEIFSYLRNRN